MNIINGLAVTSIIMKAKIAPGFYEYGSTDLA